MERSEGGGAQTGRGEVVEHCSADKLMQQARLSQQRTPSSARLGSVVPSEPGRNPERPASSARLWGSLGGASGKEDGAAEEDRATIKKRGEIKNKLLDPVLLSHTSPPHCGAAGGGGRTRLLSLDGGYSQGRSQGGT